VNVVESYVGLEFLIATLQNDAPFMSLAPGGAVRGAAKVGIAMPCGCAQFMSGIDVLTANAIRMMVNAVYLVKSFGPAANTPAVAAVAGAIDALLKRTSGYAPGGAILSCYRENNIFYDEDIGSVKYTHIGGLYRLQTQAMP